MEFEKYSNTTFSSDPSIGIVISVDITPVRIEGYELVRLDNLLEEPEIEFMALICNNENDGPRSRAFLVRPDEYCRLIPCNPDFIRRLMAWKIPELNDPPEVKAINTKKLSRNELEFIRSKVKYLFGIIPE